MTLSSYFLAPEISIGRYNETKVRAGGFNCRRGRSRHASRTKAGTSSLRIVKRSIPKIASLSGPMLFIRHACLFYIHRVQFSYPPRTFVPGVKRRFGRSTIKKKKEKYKRAY